MTSKQKEKAKQRHPRRVEVVKSTTAKKPALTIRWKYSRRLKKKGRIKSR